MFNVTLEIKQNTTFEKNFVWKTGELQSPVDLTGCTAVGQARESQSSETVAITFISPSSIVLGGTTGSIKLKLTPIETLAIPEGNYVYDILIVFPDGTKKPLIEGIIKVESSVTKV